MTEFGVHAGNFQQAIHVGRLNAKGDAFLEKVDATDMTLFAVAEYVKRHFGGGMMVNFDAFDLEIRVHEKESASKDARCPDYPAPCNCDDPETHNGH